MVRIVPTGAQDGRKREMKMIKNESARQVCFSKRRSGLFNKASELATMCGAEVAILVNSPGGRPYTFGSPTLTPVINRFLSNFSNEPDHSSSNLFGSSNKQYHHQNSTRINHLNQQYSDLSSRLDAAKFRGLMLENHLKQAAEATPVFNWYENIDQLEPDQLKQLLESLYETKAKLRARQNKLICARESSQIVNYPNTFSSLMMTNNPFHGTMAHQYEPRAIHSPQSSFNPSSRVGLNQDMMANALSINPSMMMGKVSSLNSSMMTNVRPPSEMVNQQEPKRFCSQQSSFNSSLRLGLNLNVTPVASPMATFDPITYEGTSVYEVGGSSKSDECVPQSTGVNLSSIMTNFDPRSCEESCAYGVGGSSIFEERVPQLTGGFGVSSIRSNIYPMNIDAINQGLIRFNSFPFGSNNANTEVHSIYDVKPFVPLEQLGSTIQGQVIPQIDDTIGQYLCVDDLNVLSQANPCPNEYNTKENIGPWDTEP